MWDLSANKIVLVEIVSFVGAKDRNYWSDHEQDIETGFKLKLKTNFIGCSSRCSQKC